MIEKIIVHNGVFHADDVACVSIARMLNPAVEWRRTSDTEGLDVNSDDKIIVADVGFGRFDHHGVVPKIRRDGGKHCGATLLWERFGAEAVKACNPQLDDAEAESVAKNVLEKVLYTIADGDNGIYSSAFTINCAIAQFNPSWDVSNMDAYTEARFFAAVSLMDTVLTNTIESCAAELRAKSSVMEALSHMDNGIVILEKFTPWKKVLCANSKALVVVFPSNRGGYSIQIVPVASAGYETRIHTPEEWHGKQGREAERTMPGMKFCHRNGFIASFNTKENALAAARFVGAQKN